MNPLFKRPFVAAFAVALAAGLLISCGESETSSGAAADSAGVNAPVVESVEEELERTEQQRQEFNRDAHVPHESHSATVPAR